MTSIEIKAQVFDILKEQELLQIKIQELNTRKNELLKQLELTKE
jgi:hypothetical protein